MGCWKGGGTSVCAAAEARRWISVFLPCHKACFELSRAWVRLSSTQVCERRAWPSRKLCALGECKWAALGESCAHKSISTVQVASQLRALQCLLQARTHLRATASACHRCAACRRGRATVGRSIAELLPGLAIGRRALCGLSLRPAGTAGERKQDKRFTCYSHALQL